MALFHSYKFLNSSFQVSLFKKMLAVSTQPAYYTSKKNLSHFRFPIQNYKLFNVSTNYNNIQKLHNFEHRLYSSNSAGDPSHLPPKRKSKPESKVTITWKSVLFTVIAGGGILLFVSYLKKEKELAIEKERNRVLGKAKIGSTFDLIDHNGKPCKSDDFLGKWILVYFGFTHCPDICPDELEKLAEVVDKVDNSNILPDGIQPLFITVDPQRDSIEAVSKYVKEFHPKLLGLTGSVDKIAEACRSFRVYFSAGPKDEDEDYIVDHTIIVYLINPSGEFVDYFGQTKTSSNIFDGIALSIKKYEALNSNKSLLDRLRS